jgi:hypothetical protein
MLLFVSPEPSHAEVPLIEASSPALTIHGYDPPRSQRAMPLESPDVPRWPDPLAGRLIPDASAEQVADAIEAVWLDIDQALSPIVGHRGVAALYNRSLKLAAPAHPWLACGHHDVLAAVDLPALKALVSQQAAAEGAAGGHALFQAFHELLASLVGAALTERLLRSVWAHSSGTPPAQDNSP